MSRCRAADHQLGSGFPVEVRQEGQVGEAAQQLAYQHPGFEPGDRGAEAGVWSLTEREVFGAVEVEPRGVVTPGRFFPTDWEP